MPPGILTEPGERQDRRRDRDRPQFKGIFVRHLYELHQHRPRPGYRDFILANATSLWRNSRNPRNQVGLSWTGPFDRAKRGPAGICPRRAQRRRGCHISVCRVPVTIP